MNDRIRRVLASLALSAVIATPDVAAIRPAELKPIVKDAPTERVEIPDWLQARWDAEERERLEEERRREAAKRARITSIFADGESAETVTIDGAELILLGEWRITEYCPCRICNGGFTGTASGAPLTPGRTVACNSLPFGAEIYVEGYGWRVVEDRGGGGACWVDILVETHEDAQSVDGSSVRKVWVRK